MQWFCLLFSFDCDGAGKAVYIVACGWISRLSGSNGNYETIYTDDQINSSNLYGVTNGYPQGTFNPSCEYAFCYQIHIDSESDYEFDPSITATCNGKSVDIIYVDSEDLAINVGLGTIEEIQNKAKVPGGTGSINSSGPSSGGSYEPHYTWQIGEDASSTEDGWLVLRDGLEGQIISRQRISAYPKYIEECTNKINKASDGNTVTISSSSWNSFPKSVFEDLASKTDSTLIIEFVYNHKKYKTTIKSTDIDKASLKDYYGPEALIALFPTEEIGTVNYWYYRKQVPEIPMPVFLCLLKSCHFICHYL